MRKVKKIIIYKFQPNFNLILNLYLLKSKLLLQKLFTLLLLK
jgi:hypothetical protein